jgi:hypothetical protein
MNFQKDKYTDWAMVLICVFLVLTFSIIMA